MGEKDNFRMATSYHRTRLTVGSGPSGAQGNGRRGVLAGWRTRTRTRNTHNDKSGPRGEYKSRVAQIRVKAEQQETTPTKEDDSKPKFPSLPFKKRFVPPPWQSIAPGTVLCMNVGDAVPESSGSDNPFRKDVTLPRVISNMKKAARDPRICGMYLKITPLSCGYGKIEELRRQIESFRASGKFTVAYFELGGMKEYLVASACEEFYVPPAAYFSLTGVVIENSFLRGVLEKIGIEPQVQRIGKYKSAGDQLLRKDMSDAQRTVSERLVESIYDNFVSCISKDKGKTPEEVEELLNSGPHKIKDLAEGGWLTSAKYLNEIEDLIKPRTGGPKDVLQSVGFSKYLTSTPETLFTKNAKHTVAVIRSSGAISRDSSGSNGISSASFIKSIKSVKKNKLVKAVVIRIDSPGGDALASDLMWNEIRELSKLKPVVASMVDVAASGGYYMSMACDKIVAEPLTLTGSIGVVTGKFNLEELNEKIGFNSEAVSKGKFAELNTSSRAFEDFEFEYFKAGAQKAYESFRDKAAFSRNKSIESMEEVAQGRVWTGQDAHERGLVDHIGGFDTALEVCKEMAKIPEGDAVRFMEVKSTKNGSPVLELLRNSTTVFSKLATVYTALEKLSETENIGYNASMSGFKIKDGSKDWDSNGFF